MRGGIVVIIEIRSFDASYLEFSGGKTLDNRPPVPSILLGLC